MYSGIAQQRKNLSSPDGSRGTGSIIIMRHAKNIKTAEKKIKLTNWG